MNKSDLLKVAIDEVILEDRVLDCEQGGICEDEVCIWTIEEWSNEIVSIILHYFTWFDKGNVWIDKSISEMEGPALLNCPIRFFSYPVSESSIFPQWRYEVKKFHEGAGPEVQDIKIGMRLVDSLFNKPKHKKKD